MLVPLVQGALFGSMTPVGACLPLLQGGSSESIELRAGGMIIEPWPRTRCTKPALAAHRSSANVEHSTIILFVEYRALFCGAGAGKSGCKLEQSSSCCARRGRQGKTPAST